MPFALKGAQNRNVRKEKAYAKELQFCFAREPFRFGTFAGDPQLLFLSGNASHRHYSSDFAANLAFALSSDVYFRLRQHTRRQSRRRACCRLAAALRPGTRL